MDGIILSPFSILGLLGNYVGSSLDGWDHSFPFQHSWHPRYLCRIIFEWMESFFQLTAFMGFYVLCRIIFGWWNHSSTSQHSWDPMYYVESSLDGWDNSSTSQHSWDPMYYVESSLDGWNHSSTSQHSWDPMYYVESSLDGWDNSSTSEHSWYLSEPFRIIFVWIGSFLSFSSFSSKVTAKNHFWINGIICYYPQQTSKDRGGYSDQIRILFSGYRSWSSTFQFLFVKET